MTGEDQKIEETNKKVAAPRNPCAAPGGLGYATAQTPAPPLKVPGDKFSDHFFLILGGF